MRLNCAIFDMDGTLLDSMWKWDDLGFEILRRHGREARPDFRDMTVPMGMGAAAEYCVEAYDLPCTAETIVEEMHQCMTGFYESEVKCKSGVEKFLAILKMEGVSMYVATASDRPLVEKALKSTGIAHYFKAGEGGGRWRDRGLDVVTLCFADRNAPSCTTTAQCWRITTSARFSE